MVARSGRINGVSWRLAPALSVLEEQVTDTYPDRPKGLDGTIGDPAHQERASDHNRNDDGLVTALDLTDWPGGAFDPDDWARRYAVHDPRVKYLISDGQIWSRKRAAEGWREYTGPSDHKGHLHVSVLADQANSVSPWAGIGSAPTPPKSITSTTREQIMAAIYLRDDKGRIGRFTDEAYAHLSATEWATEQATAKRFGVKSIPVVPVTRGEFDGLATSRLDVKALNRAAALAR